MGSLNIKTLSILHTVQQAFERVFMQGNQKQTHWAYIAGIMDADGCFMITRHKRKTQRKDSPHMVDNWSWTYMASVKVCMVEKEAIDLLHNDMGLGTFSLSGARPSRPNSKPIYQWGIRDRSKVRSFLENVIPFLRVKKNRAEFLLHYCKTAKYIPRNGRRYFGLSKDELVYREESYQKMREFNGKKVAAETKPSKCESISDSPNIT